MDLFAAARGRDWERIDLPGADLRWIPQWLTPGRASDLFEALREQIAWEVHRIRIFGRQVDSPRLSCWVGDAGATYVYSRTRFEPQPWTPLLADLRGDVERACDAHFNSVLANLYRHGQDAMGWHSDDEPELGAEPVIASLSLGAERSFRFRSRDGVRTVRSITLPSGSLLRMAGRTQALYQHDLPRRMRESEPRLNLTFRWIQPAQR
ncbi:alpha-ketoglutarate-dependent dioxygenase AlkB [Dyella sp.]|uniref:alpha-ketoglutarate-dependent dioxygenase AlkB family protein n=1 Tax=Dyella sp. TaxID=1869338 RepID=UPI002ED02D3B